MMQPAITLAEKHQAYYFIADYHALTSRPDPKDLRGFVKNVALDFLACGLSPEKTIFFRQSDVPEHLELTWLLSTVAPMPMLENCHSYKDKTAKGLPASHALFSYPVLMAADILIYQADAVPVGKDQKQHLEVARDIAAKFNENFGEIFKLPEPMITEAVAVIPGTDGQKMSKSYHNTIPIFGAEKEIRKRVMSIVTDSQLPEAAKDPEPNTVYQLYKMVATPQEVQEMGTRFREGGMGYGDAKKLLFEKLWTTFAPMRERREELAKDDAKIEKILQDGAQQAREVARGILKKARQAVGLE